MKRLQHKGVLVPPQSEGIGLTIMVKGNRIRLTSEQEEMALAWTRKVGTSYVEDDVFARNFHHDFSKRLGAAVELGEVDYSEVLSFVQRERIRKANLSKEERKEQASQRKAQREVNKEHYGYAWVDGEKVEIANYAVEPSCIFMGRGKHPSRGRWKEGPREEDVELNLSPDAARPPGNWKAILWQPEVMWIARWRDKLTGKMKHVWFSDSSIIKQRKDIEKFDKAMELHQSLALVQKHIWDSLDVQDTRRRKIATVSFLIDRLKIRVGDEKDPDEADTVGASTIRPEHVQFHEDGETTFRFLGKDSVPHVFRVQLPSNVIKNLKEFAENADSPLFQGVSSKHVSEFLDEVSKGLSAKVFRTYYASEAVDAGLQKASVKPSDPEYRKKHAATMANLEAAIICNHKRNIPKTWKSSLEKKKTRLKTLRCRAREGQTKLEQKTIEREERYGERLRKQQEKLNAKKKKLEAYQQQLNERQRQGGRTVHSLKKRIKLLRDRVARQRQYLEKVKTNHKDQMKGLRQRMESRRARDRTAISRLKFKIAAQKETRNFNLATSLKSYIDPRIYYEWGKNVDYDWKQYYPKSLQRKFSWVENDIYQQTHDKTIRRVISDLS
ncbi:MAG: DNA topoisomerase I [Candidatus Bathyarchaeota archaeon]|nr:MAG: DNA topoisomerase I [Candidatus Bathyarchaeota archaeon]